MSVKFPSFEHIGSPPTTDTFLDKNTVTIEPLGRNVSVPGVDESWMDGLSAAEALQQYGMGSKRHLNIGRRVGEA